MLKIKDNVDLKELEKFGLRPKYDENTGEIKGYSSLPKSEQFYYRLFSITKIKKKLLFRKYREIYKIDEEYFVRHTFRSQDDTCDFDLLYDLIKADLVEKVEE